MMRVSLVLLWSWCVSWLKEIKGKIFSMSFVHKKQGFEGIDGDDYMLQKCPHLSLNSSWDIQVEIAKAIVKHHAVLSLKRLNDPSVALFWNSLSPLTSTPCLFSPFPADCPGPERLAAPGTFCSELFSSSSSSFFGECGKREMDIWWGRAPIIRLKSPSL